MTLKAIKRRLRRRRRTGRKRTVKVVKREPNGRAQREPQEPMLPTQERLEKVAGGVDLEETDRAGVRVVRIKHECLLDALRTAGDLGTARTGERRYAAGMWLRRLYLRTQQPVVVGAYGHQTAAAHEMSDEMAEAHATYNRTIIAMGDKFCVLRDVCCHDTRRGTVSLQYALDYLADWRGM